MLKYEVNIAEGVAIHYNEIIELNENFKSDSVIIIEEFRIYRIVPIVDEKRKLYYLC